MCIAAPAVRPFHLNLHRMSNQTAAATVCRRRTAPTPKLARAAYQGVPGAFGEDAVHRLWNGSMEAYPMVTFDAVLDALIDGDVECAVLPVWNSTIGRVQAAHDALDARARMVVRTDEVDVPVRHCLLALAGASLADVRYVGSHPAALAQCKRLFRQMPHLTPVVAFDTAGAASQLASFGDAPASGGDRWYDALAVGSPKALAAIASAKAASAYGLEVLWRGVNDEPTNFTRFVALRAREVRR